MYGIRDFHSLNSFTYLIWFMLPDLRFFFFLLSPLYFKIRMLFGCFYNNRNYLKIYHLFIYWKTVSMALTVILVLKTLHWCFVFPLPSTYWTEKVIQCSHILKGSLSSTNYIDPALRKADKPNISIETRLPFTSSFSFLNIIKFFYLHY